MRIRPIPQEIVHQIAAGEVIEGPRSAVKELVENSLDAGATEISVELEEGGIASIIVRDNGSGIAPEDLPLALHRHTTSKLDFNDPWGSLQSFGFRGEALFALANSAEVIIHSRVQGSPEGYGIHALPGELPSEVFPVPHPPGTTVWVKGLFRHLPARLKFLRSPQSEAQRVRELLLGFILSQPKVGFRLSHNARILLDTPPSSIRTRLELLLEVSEWIEGEGEIGPLRYLAYLAPPTHTLPTSRGIFTFVNNRIVRDAHLRNLLLRLYRDLIPKDRYPLALLALFLPPEEVDPNVHPAKLEVRFRGGDSLFPPLFRTLRSLLLHPSTSPVPSLPTSPSPPPFPDSSAEPLLPYPAPSSLPPSSTPPPTPTPLIPEGEYLGTLGDRYLLFKAGRDLLLLDQHASHERIRYEEILAGGSGPPIPLLLPAIWKPPTLPTDPLPHLLPLLQEIGFHLEPWGPQGYVLRAVPPWCTGDPIPLLSALLEEGEDLRSLSLPREILERFALLACKSSIRTGDPLLPQEAQLLLEKLRRTPNPTTCPHGRPTFRILTFSELDRLFLR